MIQLLYRALFIALLFANTAHGDPQSKAFSQWQFADNSARLTYTIASREATRIPEYQFNADLSAVLAEHLQQTVSVQQDGIDCAASQPQKKRSKPGYERFSMTFTCPHALQNPKVIIRTLFPYAGSHVHFAKFKVANRPVFEYLYTGNKSAYDIPLVEPDPLAEAPVSDAWAVFATYVYLGFEHILIGIDHIAFLFTLLLMAARLRDVLLIVTGFTLGHSITLSLAVLQWASPNIMVIEALIGFTIALVAAENIAAQTGSSRRIASIAAALFAVLAMVTALSHRGPPLLSLLGLALFCLCYLRLSDSRDKALRLRPAVTTLFGLIHGFGFASVLMEVGLPQQRILPALFGFNLGVEFGQVAIVLAITALGLILRRYISNARVALGTEMLSAILCGLGMFWFIQRSYYA